MEKSDRYLLLALHSYRIELKILNEKASELWEENRNLSGNPLNADKADKNMRMIIQIQKKIINRKKELSHWLNTTIEQMKKDEEYKRLCEQNNTKDFITSISKDFSDEEEIRNIIYKELLESEE